MNCHRAVALLRGLEKNELPSLALTSEDIEELLKFSLAIESDPEDLTTFEWLAPVVAQYARRSVDDAHAAQGLAQVLRQTEEELQKDWYRIKTSKTELAEREASRVTMRRALALLGDPRCVAAMGELMAKARVVAPGAGWVACPALGSEVYALTHKGWRVRRQLKIRLERFGEVELEEFLRAFDKIEGKMAAFAGDITALSSNVGYVRKNREQVVIGLMKTGAPVPQALAAYQAGLRVANQAPDVAVTCARNASVAGSPAQAARLLEQAKQALRRGGFPDMPVVMGAAKCLLAFNPPDAGVARFKELCSRLGHMLGGDDLVYKMAARLMPAHGTPSDVVRRAVNAASLLRQQPSRANPSAREVRMASAALASMVRDDAALPSLVTRFREVEYELVRAGVSGPAQAEAHALECVVCPGTPYEVVDTVSALVAQLGQGRRAEPGDVGVAVAFAKRFAL